MSESEIAFASRVLGRKPSSEAESVLASRGPDGRSSSESELAFASRVLGRELSSEAEISSTVSEAFGVRIVVLGRGPSVTWA